MTLRRLISPEYRIEGLVFTDDYDDVLDRRDGRPVVQRHHGLDRGGWQCTADVAGGRNRQDRPIGIGADGDLAGMYGEVRQIEQIVERVAGGGLVCGAAYRVAGFSGRDVKRSKQGLQWQGDVADRLRYAGGADVGGTDLRRSRAAVRDQA